jgi:hypothetical protein
MYLNLPQETLLIHSLGPPVGNVTITNQQIVFNPYLTSETGPFQNSDYNAIINNAVGERLSEWYQQIDYATNQTVPVNFAQLIIRNSLPSCCTRF